MKNKRYWWLKLREDFFKQKEMKKLRRMAGGDTYTIIYLKMQLLSLKKHGIILYESIEENLSDELALELDEDTENVQMTLLFLQKHGLIDQIATDEYLLPEAAENIGTESASAERMRQHRERQSQNQKTLLSHCDADVTASDEKVTLEKEIDIRERLTPPISPPRGAVAGQTSGRSIALTESFELFWETYPNKKAQAAAEKAWQKLNPSPEQVKQILSAIENQKQSRQWLKDNGQYIPEPANWIKDMRWQDELNTDIRTSTNDSPAKHPEASYDLDEIEASIKKGIF